MKEKMLARLYDHFNFKEDDQNDGEPFYCIKGEGIPRFLLEMQQISTDERYMISNPLLLNLTYETSATFLSAFLDYHTQLFTMEPPNQRNAPQRHRHNYFELAYVVDGQLDLLIENSRHRMMAGDACIINTNVRHQELRTEAHMVIYLGIDPENLPFLANSLGKQDGASLDDFFSRNRKGSDEIEYLNFTPLDTPRANTGLDKINTQFRLLMEELLTQDTGYQPMCEILIQRLFAVLQNPSAYICSNTRFQAADGNSLFEHALRYISDHKRKITRQELEQALRYNGTYISRVFLKRTGQSLAEYNRDVCMTEAARLLLNTELNIRDICHRIGYENKTVFYNLFRKKYGLTPQQYRDMKYQQTAGAEDSFGQLNPHITK